MVDNLVFGNFGSPHYASALRAGVKIGPKKQFFTGAKVMAIANDAGSSTYCFLPWANVKRRYLGLRISINGETHFGWARLNVSCDLRHIEISGTLTGYAYETTPNKAIIAGNRGSTTGQGPEAEAASLGRLALGAAGKKTGPTKPSAQPLKPLSATPLRDL